MSAAETESEVVWRVTRTEDKKVDVYFGPSLSEAPSSDEAKLQVLGKALISLGTQLMTSTTDEDES